MRLGFGLGVVFPCLQKILGDAFRFISGAARSIDEGTVTPTFTVRVSENAAFTLTGGVDLGDFTLFDNGDGTADVTLNLTPNFDIQTSHVVEVSATFEGETITQLLTVSVVDLVNEARTILNALTGSFSLPENAAQMTTAGTLGNTTNGSTLSLFDNAGNRLALDGLDIQRGATGLDFEAATSHSFTVRETHPDAEAPRDTTFTLTVSNINEVVLNTLTLSTNTLPTGEAATVNILGATAGSTITGSVPSGMTLNSGARTITGTPDTAQNNTIALTESADDATDRVSNVALNVTDPARTIFNTLANSNLPGEDIDGFVARATSVNDELNTLEGGNVVIDFTQSASSIVTALDDRITVLENADVTAPVLTRPSAVQTGETTADLAVFTDEVGGTLFAVLTASATAPTPQQVEDGQDHTGATVISISQPVNSLGEQAIPATSLTAETGYYAHFMHKDAAGNRSDVVSAAQFTTAAAQPALSPVTAHVNFSSNPEPGYNFVNRGAGQISPPLALSDDAGNSTGWTVETIGTWGGNTSGGKKTGDDSGAYPDQVMRFAIYIRDVDGTVTFRFSGLEPSALYDLTSMCNRDSIANNGIFAVNGQEITVEGEGNTSAFALFEDIQPNSSGIIDFAIRHGGNGTYASVPAITIFQTGQAAA